MLQSHIPGSRPSPFKTRPMTHEPRQTALLRQLLQQRRSAALGTLDPDGAPFVSMVPFAIEPSAGVLVLHVSALAAHTGHMMRNPRVSLLVSAAEHADQSVHDLPRVSIDALAALPDAEADVTAARSAYLARFPEAAFMTELPDFRFVTLQALGARHVAGFGSARRVDAEELMRVLKHPGRAPADPGPAA